MTEGPPEIQEVVALILGQPTQLRVRSSSSLIPMKNFERKFRLRWAKGTHESPNSSFLDDVMVCVPRQRWDRASLAATNSHGGRLLDSLPIGLALYLQTKLDKNKGSLPHQLDDRLLRHDTPPDLSPTFREDSDVCVSDMAKRR